MQIPSYNRLLQCVSYIINRHSTLPLVSRIQIYDNLRDYFLEQEFRIQQLETRIKSLEHNLAYKQNTLDNTTDNNLSNKLVMAIIPPNKTSFKT